jgi:uncharacterized membrane protein YdjX (TVP38/TMEM64 family)
VALAQPAADSVAGLLPALLRASALAALLLGVGFVFRQTGADWLRHVHPDAAGGLAFLGIGAGLTAAGAPRQVVAFAGGFVFGPAAGGALALAAQMLACAANFFAARGVAGEWARRRLGGGQSRVERLVRRKPFTATLTLRLLPAGNNLLLNVAAGIAGIPAVPFLAASLLGYLPQTAIFALLGSGAELGHAVQLECAGVLFAASFALAGWLLWHERQHA